MAASRDAFTIATSWTINSSHARPLHSPQRKRHSTAGVNPIAVWSRFGRVVFSVDRVSVGDQGIIYTQLFSSTSSLFTAKRWQNPPRSIKGEVFHKTFTKIIYEPLRIWYCWCFRNPARKTTGSMLLKPSKYWESHYQPQTVLYEPSTVRG